MRAPSVSSSKRRAKRSSRPRSSGRVDKAPVGDGRARGAVVVHLTCGARAWRRARRCWSTCRRWWACAPTRCRWKARSRRRLRRPSATSRRTATRGALGGRAAWHGRRGRDVPTLADRPQAEYVYWPGCSGAYDARNRKVSRALVALLLRHAGVDFAVTSARRRSVARRGAAHGQRVSLVPPACHREHRDAERPRREEDHRAVPALRPGAGARLPSLAAGSKWCGTRSCSRGSWPKEAAGRGAGGRAGGVRARHVPRLVLPGTPTPTCTTSRVRW